MVGKATVEPWLVELALRQPPNAATSNQNQWIWHLWWEEVQSGGKSGNAIFWPNLLSTWRSWWLFCSWPALNASPHAGREASGQGPRFNRLDSTLSKGAIELDTPSPNPKRPKLRMQNWMCMISSLILVKRLRTSPEHTSFWYLLSYYTWQLRPKFWHNLDRARGLANKKHVYKQEVLFINMSWSVISRCCCALENHMLHVLCFSSDIMMPVRLGVTSNLNKHQALVCYPPFVQCLSCSAPTSFATAVV